MTQRVLFVCLFVLGKVIVDGGNIDQLMEGA